MRARNCGPELIWSGPVGGHPRSSRPGEVWSPTLTAGSRCIGRPTLTSLLGALGELAAEFPSVPRPPAAGLHLVKQEISVGILSSVPWLSHLRRVGGECDRVLTDSRGIQEETTALGIPS